MKAVLPLLIAAAAVLIFYLREKTRRYTLRAVYLKTLLSVLFVTLGVCAWFLSAPDARPGILGLFVIPGLLFGLLGDVWLDLKYVFPEKDAAFTYAGFVSFGIGHLLYMTGLILQFSVPGKTMYILLPFLLAVLLSIGNVKTEKLMKLRFGSMKTIVLIYGALLFAMVLLAGSLALLHGWQERTLNLFFLGGVLFALSDLILSGTYFGEGHERPIDLILNYLTYYPAQFLIALSLLYLR